MVRFPTTLGIAGLLFSAAAAQVPDVAPLTPLVVTAQKRGQPIENVPLAVTAYTGATLANLGVTDYTSLAPLVPGFFISSQSPAYPSFNIRGVGTDSNDPRQQPRVSVFFDGVAITRTAGSTVALFDLAEAEVLKGPQGTLFGRNALAGALALTSRRPEIASSAELTLGVGDANRRHAAGFVNAPLAGQQLAARVAFSVEQVDGDTTNLSGGPALNGRDSLAVRPSLRWQPQADTTVDLILTYQRDTPSGVAFKSGVIPTSLGDTSPFTPAELNRGAALGTDRTVWGATFALEHRFNAHWHLAATTAIRRFDAHEESDIDGSRLFLLETGDDQTGREFSQELRFHFDDGAKLAGFFGASFAHERAEEQVDLATDERIFWPFLSANYRSGLLAAGVPSSLAFTAVPVMNPFAPQGALPAGFAAFGLVPPLAPLAALAGAPLRPFVADRYRNDAALDAVDVFADGTWRATDKLEFTAGLRISSERQTTGYNAPVDATPATVGFILGATPNFAIAPTAGRLTDRDNSTGWAGRVAMRYELTPRSSLYGNIGRSRRPPALIITSTDRVLSREETVTSAEVGAKGQSADARLRWSAVVFAYRYQHFQTTVQDPTNLARFIPIDAGQATGRGGEFSLSAQPTRELGAIATYAYTDATFDDRAASGAAQQFAGSTFRLTSRHTAALALDWTRPLANGQFSFVPRWEYRSAHFFDDNNALAGGTLRQPGGGLLHARLAWSSANRRWEFTAFVRNALNRDYLIDAGNTGASFGIPTFVRGEPRRLGFDVTHRW